MRLCEIDGCERKHYGKGMCHKHYMQVRMYGSIIPHSKTDPNEIRVEGDVAYIVLRDIKRQPVGEAMIDACDVELCSKYKWHKQNFDYVIALIDGRRVALHRFIMGIPEFVSFDEVVDHINHDRMDNRKANLRIVTQQENLINTSAETTASSGVKGVYRDKRRGQWFASIGIDGVNKFLGYYDSVEQAAAARKAGESKYHAHMRPQQ